MIISTVHQSPFRKKKKQKNILNQNKAKENLGNLYYYSFPMATQLSI